MHARGLTRNVRVWPQACGPDPGRADLRSFADEDMVARLICQRHALEPGLGGDDLQARPGAEVAPLGRAAPFERHRDDTAGEADVEFEATLFGVPERVLADALAAGDPAVVGRADVRCARLEDVECELPALGQERARGGQGAQRARRRLSGA